MHTRIHTQYVLNKAFITINMVIWNLLYLLAYKFSMYSLTKITAKMAFIILCDRDVHTICEETVLHTLPFQIEYNTNLTVNFTGQCINSTGNFISNLEQLDNSENQVLLLAGFGGENVVNAVVTTAQTLQVPAFVYSTWFHKKYLYTENIIEINPDRIGLAQAIIALIGTQMMDRAFVICQDSLLEDGFLHVFKTEPLLHRSKKRHYAIVSALESDSDIKIKLILIHDNGFRLIIVHTSMTILDRIVKIAQNLSYFGVGYVWLVTEEALSDITMTKGTDIQERISPSGLLAIDSEEVNKYPEIFMKLMETIINQTKIYIQNTGSLVPLPENSTSNIGDIIFSSKEQILQFNRGMLSDRQLFGDDGRRQKMQFRLSNLIRGANDDKPEWKTVGYIQDGNINLNTIFWPSQTIFGMTSCAHDFYTIVTKPAEPFIYIRGPVESSHDCIAGTVCLKLFTYVPNDIRAAINSFKTSNGTDYDIYDIYCCEGIVVDILHSLSLELKFSFLLYMHNDSNYGYNENGQWTGMVGDVINGAADLMAGALSITSARMKVLTFTEAFYFSSFTMISKGYTRSTPLLAFLRPFDTVVWVMLIVSATGVAVVTSLFEWNSPFGLNPWGKQRKQNYTFGSALTMVYSIWFGQTVKIKSPKSWPSKVLQNCWACLAIFVLASYTANLTAFLAGKEYADDMFSILDPQLNSKKVSVIPTSAVEGYIKVINSDLHARLERHYVRNIDEAFYKLRNNNMDLYLDDSPLIDYALSRLDENCSLKYAAYSFGGNSYAFGLKKGSWLKKQLDPLILNYVELGYVESLKGRYHGKKFHCLNTFLTSKYDTNNHMFGLQHTSGIFIMLLTAIGLALTLLVLEHIVYFILLPRIKKKPMHTFWKMRSIEYFSQRFYKAINSEKVETPAKALISKFKSSTFKTKKLTLQIQNRQSCHAKTTMHRLTNTPMCNLLKVVIPKSTDSKESYCSDNGIFTVTHAMTEQPNDVLWQKFDDKLANLMNRQEMICLDNGRTNGNCVL